MAFGEAWGYEYIDSCCANRNYLYVDHEVNQQVAGADMSLGTFVLRFYWNDPVSTTAAATIYQTFTVTFTYQCSGDYFTLSGKSEQSF